MKNSLTRTLIKSTPQPIRHSLWGSHHARVHPRLLPLQFGDGRQDVIISFYHAPEIEILVKFDSSLPLDLPEDERFETYKGIRSFRDVTDEVYEACQRLLPRKPWTSIIKNGSTWCHA